MKTKIMYFLDLMLEVSLTYIKVLFFISIAFFIYKNQKFRFDPRTKTLTYNELPNEIKYRIQEFENTANQYHVDVSKIKTIEYVLLYDNKTDFGGYSGRNRIYINLSRGLDPETLWHELGHQVLNYGHDLRDQTSHIMNSGRSQYLPTTWENQKRSFFEEPMPRNYVKNLIDGFSRNNYLYYSVKESLFTLTGAFSRTSSKAYNYLKNKSKEFADNFQSKENKI